MTNQPSDKETRQEKGKLFEHVKDFDTTVLVTRTGSGELRGRPMAIAELSQSDGVWFATTADNAMIDEISRDPQVCLSMQSKSQFVSLSGRATIHDDRGKVHQLWNPSWQIWFPNGKDDPKIRLIQVLPSAGDYWDMAGKNRWQVLCEKGEAYYMHPQPIYGEQTHAHVDLGSKP